MKLWVPDIPDPVLIDTDETVGGWSEQIREIYEMVNYTASNVTVEPGDVCIDIGASIGMWSRWACDWYGWCNPCDLPRRINVLGQVKGER